MRFLFRKRMEKIVLIRKKSLLSTLACGTINMSKYDVRVTNRAKKGFRKLSHREKAVFNLLVRDLKDKGPELRDWRNYSKLGRITHHCHIGYH